MLQIRVELDLVDGGLNLCRLEDGLEVLLEEVGNANGLCSAGLLDLLKVRPALLQLLLGVGEIWRVYEVEIHVLQVELLQGECKGLFGVLLLCSTDFGGDVELLAGQLARLDGGTHFLLVAILCRPIVSFHYLGSC